MEEASSDDLSDVGVRSKVFGSQSSRSSENFLRSLRKVWSWWSSSHPQLLKFEWSLSKLIMRNQNLIIIQKSNLGCWSWGWWLPSSTLHPSSSFLKLIPHLSLRMRSHLHHQVNSMKMESNLIKKEENSKTTWGSPHSPTPTKQADDQIPQLSRSRRPSSTSSSTGVSNHLP